MTTTYYARSYYNGDASNRDFAVPFPYLATTHLKAYVSGASVPFTYNSPTSIKLATAPAAGTGNVAVIRETPIDAMLHTIQSGSILPADINVDAVQLLYLIQERDDHATYNSKLAIHAPDSDVGLDMVLPLAGSARDGLLLTFSNGLPALVTAAGALATGAGLSASNMAALQALVTAGIAAGTQCFTPCYSTSGDGGGGFFEVVTTGTPDAGLILTTAGGAGHYLKRIFQGPVRSEYYGISAALSGATNSARINAALAAASTLKRPYEHAAGLIVPVDGTITIPASSVVHWNGGGIDATLAAVAPTNNSTIYSVGSFSALPALSVNVAEGATSLTFASAPSVSPGDPIFLYSTDVTQIWSIASGSKTYYKGEAVEVTRVSGNTVYLSGPTYDSYVTTKTALGKLNENNLEMTGLVATGDAISTTNVIFLGNLGRKSKVENIYASGPTATQTIAIDRPYFATLENINPTRKQAAGGNSTYALVIINGHGARVRGGTAQSVWHSASIGGDSGAYNIINRHIVIEGMRLHTDPAVNNGVPAADIHGNAQYCGYHNCPRIDSIELGGDQCFITGATVVYGGSSFGLPASAISLSEMRSFNHYIASTVTVIAKGTNTHAYGLCFDTDSPNGGGTVNNLGGVTRFHAKCYYSHVDSAASTQYVVSWLTGACTATDTGLDLSEAQFNLVSNNGTLGGGIQAVGNVTYPSKTVILPKKCSTYFSDVRYTKSLNAQAIESDCLGCGTTPNHNVVTCSAVSFRGATGFGADSGAFVNAAGTTVVDFMGVSLISTYTKAIIIDATGNMNSGNGHWNGYGATMANLNTVYHTTGPNDGAITHGSVGTYKTSTFA